MTDENAPGKCADCGSDAYIQMAGDDAFVCAHCFAGHAAARRRPADGSAEPEAPMRRTG
ncbi:MAG TPA: hypothetical protein VIN34_06495 [Candidatus Limnocylindria bacterium]|jgi:hypothetical protein